MGYPMTWKRVLFRNAFADGDDSDVPAGWQPHVNTELLYNEERAEAYPYLAERLERYKRQAMGLAGDLRRLEHDAKDEQNLCLAIERRTGINHEIVATVLKEFFDV